MTDAENAIYEVSDYRPHLFRPPGGLRSNLITELADEMDYSIVLWSIDTLDWSKNTDVNYVLKTVRKNIKDGAIILCHDSVSYTHLDVYKRQRQPSQPFPPQAYK